MDGEELRLEPLDRDERSDPRDGGRPAPAAQHVVGERVGDEGRREPRPVGEPHPCAQYDVSTEEDVGDPPEPGEASRIGRRTEDEAERRSEASAPWLRRIERPPQRHQEDEEQRPDAMPNEAEEVERAAGRRRREAERARHPGARRRSPPLPMRFVTGTSGGG